MSHTPYDHRDWHDAYQMTERLLTEERKRTTALELELEDLKRIIEERTKTIKKLDTIIESERDSYLSGIVTRDSEIERLKGICEDLVGEETLHQDGQYEGHLSAAYEQIEALKKDNDSLRRILDSCQREQKQPILSDQEMLDRLHSSHWKAPDETGA